MQVFHGSHVSRLKNLEFKEENSRFIDVLDQVYGRGIYMAEKEDVARAYAVASLYEVKINGPIFDTSDKDELMNVVKKIANILNLDEDLLLENEMIQKTLYGVTIGEYSDIFEQITLIIDNDIFLYNMVIDSAGEDYNELIENFQKEWTSVYSTYKYFHKTMGNVFICYDYKGSCLDIINEELIINED